VTTIDQTTDHMSPFPLARISDIQVAIYQRWNAYWIAGPKIGLTHTEQQEFLSAIADADPSIKLGVLPRRLDAMAARTPTGHVYVAHHVMLPAGTYGWSVLLSDGTTVLIPRLSGDLSMIHGKPAPPAASVGK